MYKGVLIDWKGTPVQGVAVKALKGKEVAENAQVIDQVVCHLCDSVKCVQSMYVSNMYCIHGQYHRAFHTE